MKWIERLFHIAGYGLHIKQDTTEIYNIDELPIHTSHQQKISKCYMQWIYVIVIFIVMSWSIVYAVVESILTKDLEWLYKSTFHLLISLQYLMAVIFMNRNEMFKKLDNSRILVTYLRRSLFASIVVAFVLSIIFICLVINEHPVYIYTKIYTDTNSTGILILLFFDMFFSYLTLLINLTCFTISMMYHKNRLIEYRDKTIEFSKSSVSLAQKINSITVEYTYLKQEFENTVDTLNTFFVILNVLGILHTYFVISLIQAEKVEFKDIWDMLLYFIVEYIYIMSAQKVKKALGDISSVVQSPTYIDACIRKNTTEKIIPYIASNVSNETLASMVIQSYITTVEQSETIAWLTLKNIVCEEWATFNILGLISINETSILQKIFGVVCAVLMSNDIINLLSING